MARLSNEDMADMHMAYGQRQCESHCTQVVSGAFSNRYLHGHRMFANLYRRLRELGSFNENRRGFGRPRELRVAVDEYVLQYIRGNPHTRTRGTARDLGIRNHVDV